MLLGVKSGNPEIFHLEFNRLTFHPNMGDWLSGDGAWL
ncbi:hypothetical protein [Salmonella phage PS3-1]|nr:hypothetical protein [Salmonella phage PS3-1]